MIWEIASTEQLRSIMDALDNLEDLLEHALSVDECDRAMGVSLSRLRDIASASLESREESMLIKFEVGAIKEAIR